MKVNLPHFYAPEIETHPFLEGEEFKHCIKVLRKKPGDQIAVMNGCGTIFESEIINVQKDKSELKILKKTTIPKKAFKVHLVIAPTKNADRIEWMVEKACELGLDEITFIQTQNSERAKLKTERLEKKAISALKQSKTGYKLQINSLIRFSDFIQNNTADHKFIAIVEDGLPYFMELLQRDKDCTVLIGPEGDFSEEEVKRATDKGFKKISLGNATLRTETAGLIATHFVNVVNAY